MKPVGYLVNYPEGLNGETGLYYNYILASNGLFIETENKAISVRIPVAECEVRGLSPVTTKISLTYGSIPQRFFDLALDSFLADPQNERYVAITAAAGYHFYEPIQDREKTKVVYEIGDDIIMEIHSHGNEKAFFSPQDNKDEKGLKLYAVVGNLNVTPVVRLRIGVYGYFMTLAWKDVFDGTLSGVTEYEREEVKSLFDLQCGPDELDAESQHSSNRLRWDWWFRR